MKNSIFLFVFLFGLVLQVKDTFGQTVEFGFKGGINSANLVGDGIGGSHSVIGEDRRTGLMVGGITALHLPLLPFYLQTELLYIQKGFRPDETVMRKIRSTRQLDYIELPFLAVFDIASHRFLTLFIYGGYYFSFLINATDKHPGDIKLDVSYAYKDHDSGLAFGAGLGIFKNIYVDARYSLGLKDITPYHLSQRNRMLSIATGIKF